MTEQILDIVLNAQNGGAAAAAGRLVGVSPEDAMAACRRLVPEIAGRARDKAPENGPDPTNVINTGYAIGGVNLCGDTPIILPVDGPSQGGFITPVVVVSAALWKVGQLRPNRKLVFRRVGIDAAIAMRTALDRLVADPRTIVTGPAS